MHAINGPGRAKPTGRSHLVRSSERLEKLKDDQDRPASGRAGRVKALLRQASPSVSFGVAGASIVF